MHTHRTNTPVLLLSLPVLFLIAGGCIPAAHRASCGLGHAYPGAGSLGLDRTSLQEGMANMLEAVGDTAAATHIHDVWRAGETPATVPVGSSLEPTVGNLVTATLALHRAGLTIATPVPATYEALNALAKLPVFLWVLAILHDDPKTDLVPGDELNIGTSPALRQHAEKMRLYLITDITTKGEFCRVGTQDGFAWEALPSDRLEGQVVPADKALVGAPYLQLVVCLAVTTLPETEIAGHIEDWYSNMPFTSTKPSIRVWR